MTRCCIARLNESFCSFGIRKRRQCQLSILLCCCCCADKAPVKDYINEDPNRETLLGIECPAGTLISSFSVSDILNLLLQCNIYRFYHSISTDAKCGLFALSVTTGITANCTLRSFIVYHE